MIKKIKYVFAITVLLLAGASVSYSGDIYHVKIFGNNDIHFTPDNPARYDTENVIANDNGRVITRLKSLPEFKAPVKIMANIKIHPITKDPLSVHDKWDRAGNIRLAVDGMPDIEIIKFVTAYGGYTEYSVDVSHLAPLLSGERTFKAFIDTWVSPAWKINFQLSYWLYDLSNPDLIIPLMFTESFNAQDVSKDGILVDVEIPENVTSVKMHYLVSGHCTDGRDADEFISKYNVISVDGIVVYRYKPWRDDCKQFRAINPYTKRWSDGNWSSDYSRSGWCPGDIVEPLELDLSDHLTPGKHTVKFVIEDIRPKDENDHFGYWRVSSYLLGWKNR